MPRHSFLRVVVATGFALLLAGCSSKPAAQGKGDAAAATTPKPAESRYIVYAIDITGSYTIS